METACDTLGAQEGGRKMHCMEVVQSSVNMVGSWSSVPQIREIPKIFSPPTHIIVAFFGRRDCFHATSICDSDVVKRSAR